MKQPSEPSPL